MKNILMVVITAITAAAITMACGAPVAQPEAGQPTTQVTAEAQKPEPTAQVVQYQTSGPGYWTLSSSKAFKAVEWACSMRWKAVDMPTGCVIVVDKTRKGYGHNGVTGPFGIVIPFESGVTITSGWDTKVYVSSAPKKYTWVVLDESDARIVQSSSSDEGIWDNELLREFFIAQMGGQVETIWREGVSDID